MELACIGLLWCSGTQKQKAQFIAKIINVEKSNFVTYECEELKFIFTKLFYLSINLAENIVDIQSKIDQNAKKKSIKKCGSNSFLDTTPKLLPSE